MKRSYPRNICTEHWRKLPNFAAFWEIFIYTYRTCVKSFVNWAIYLFPRQNKVFTPYLVDLVVFNFCFYLVLPFYFLKWNCYCSVCKQKFVKFFKSFLKAHISFPSNFAPMFSAINHNSSKLFLAQKISTLVKSSPLKRKLLRFLSAQVKIRQNPHVSFELTGQSLFNYYITLHCHGT